MRYRNEEEIKKMSVKEIIQYCHEMKDNIRTKVLDCNLDNYEWGFGVEIVSRIRDELTNHISMDKPERATRFLGIDVKRPYSTDSPYRIMLREKAPKKLYITTADHRVSPLYQEFMRTALNTSVYGRDGLRAYLDIIDEMDYLKKSEPAPWLKVNYAAMFDRNVFVKKQRKESIMGLIKNVIFNDPATIVYWRDGSKTVVKAQDEPFDPEKGLAMAIVKRCLGNEGNYYELFKEWLPEKETLIVRKTGLSEEAAQSIIDGINAGLDSIANKLEEPANPNDFKTFPSEDLHITVADFAKHFNVTVDKVRREIKAGNIEAVKIKGKWLIPYCEVTKYGM